jgi:KUP system potassium uptake protein
VEFLSSLPLHRVPRTPGTGVFLSPEGEVAATSFMHYLSEHRSLPERLVFVRLKLPDAPHVAMADAATVECLDRGVWLATVQFGFDDEPDVPAALQASPALASDPRSTRYYLRRETARELAGSRMARWRQRLYAAMLSVSVPAIEALHLPFDRTSLLP